MQMHVCNDLLFWKCKNTCNLNHDVTTKHSMSIWHRYNMSEEEMNSSNENSILASIMPAIPASPPRQDNIPIGGTQADVASAMNSCPLNKSPAIQWGDTSMEMQAIKPQANSSTIPKKRTSPGSPNLRGVHYSPVNIESAQIDAAATEPASMRGHLPHYQGHVANLGTYWELCPKESRNCPDVTCKFSHILARAANDNLVPVNYLWQYRLPEPASEEDCAFYYEAIKRCSSTGFLWIDFLDEDQELIENAFCKLKPSFTFPNIPLKYAIQHLISKSF